MVNIVKSIAITGATGFVARNLRKEISSDYNLISFSRKNFKSFSNEIKIITNEYERPSIVKYLRNCEILVHLIGIGNQSPDSEFSDINVKITNSLVHACKSAKIKKIIYLSGLGVSPKNTSNYFKSKFQAEQIIIKSGLDYTIFRPSYIIGKNDYLTKSLKSQAKKGIILIPGSGKYQIQPILISDVVKIIKSSFYIKKFSRKIIDLVGPENISFENFVKFYSKKYNCRTSKIPLEKSLKNSLINPNYPYKLEDLNILIGEFLGNFGKLRKLYESEFQSVREFL